MASQNWFDKDFYKILGVSKDATQADLKKAYRKLARKYHPDSNAGDKTAEARFKEISEAHAVLSDPERRKEYDQLRAMGQGARFTAGEGGGEGFEDVFGNLFGQGGRGQNYTFRQGASFEDLFGAGRFGQATGGYQGYGGPTPGRDVIASVTLDFVTATQGDTVQLQTGEGRPLTVKIPAGVANGQKIRVRGRGEPSPDGGEPGDIVLTITVRKHPVFERDGLNLRVKVPITFTEASLGATIEVPTLGGEPVKLKVPGGTPSGRVLRVKGRGVSTAKGTGDLLAEVVVTVPSRLSGTAEQALRDFAASMPRENPRQELLERAKHNR